MAIFTIKKINGVDVTITEDESAGLQTSGVATSTEDNNDNDVAALSTSTASNPISISAELSNALTADGITAPAAIGYAEVDGFATISTTANIGDVFFSAGTDQNGTPLPINGIDSGLKTDSGAAILLYSSKDNNVVYGRAGSSTGALVFAIVLHETKTNGITTGADIGIVQYQAISNPIAGGPGTNATGIINFDDAVDLTNKLFVSVSTETVISDFSTAPSGQDVWAGIRPPAEKTAPNSPLDLLVTGGNPNNGETVNVSTTGLGTNSQAVDPNELLRIDFVSNVFIATSSQAHTQSTLDYGMHVLSRGAGWSPVQVNPGSPNARVSAMMTAYDAAGDFKGSPFFTNIFNQTEVKISSVQVFAKDGTTSLGTLTGTGTFAGDANLSATFSGNSVRIDGLLSDYRVAFRTSADMDRFTITNVSAKNTFDVGRIANLGANAETVEVGSHIRFEDDGPTAAIGLNAGATVTHDETAGAQVAGGATDTNSQTVAALFTSVTNLSTDYTNDDLSGTIYAQSASAVVNSTGSNSGADSVNATTKFSLSLSSSSGVDSGLATTDGKEIWLFKDSTSGLVIGRIGSGASGATADPNGLAAIAIALNADTGVLSLAQYASIKHGTADNGTDSSEPAKITDTALQAVVTVTDGDKDQATASKDIGNAVVILDDGPTASVALTGNAVTHDETPDVQTANGANDTGNAAVGALFANVANPSTQLSTDTAPYAQDGAIVTTADSKFGADEEGASKVLSLVVANVTSGLQTTDGTNIFLAKEASGIAGEDLVVGRIGGTNPAINPAAFAIALDQNGVVSVAQYASLKHPITTNPNDSVSITDGALQALVTVTDGDGDTATATKNIGNEIKFLDDGPSIIVNATPKPTLPTTDPLAPATSSANGDFSVDFTPTYGVDGQGATPVSYALSLGSTSSGLTDSLSGLSVVLSVNADGSLVTGKTSSNLTVFTVGVDGTGKVTLTQSRAVVQGTGENPDGGETVGLTGTNVVKLTATATDGDGDQAPATLDLTTLLSFKDVGPTITVANITNGTYAAGGSSTWSEAPNADGFKSLNVTLNDYKIDSHSTVTVNGSLGTDTTTDANGNYVFNGSIKDDFNGDGTPETVPFKLTFDPVANTYKIDVTTPPTTVTTFDTSQGSLPAGGPTPVQSLPLSSGPAAGTNIVFFGVKPQAPTSGVAGGDVFGNPPNPPTPPPNDLEDLVYPGVTDLTKAKIDSYLTPSNQISSLIDSATQMNVSTSGIGVNNNNMDGDSTSGISSGDESFVVNPQLPVDIVTVQMDNSVGGYTPETGEQLYYTVYYQSGVVGSPVLVDGINVPLSAVASGPAAGGRQFTISDTAQTGQIDAVQLTMASGKAKIPVIAFSVQQTFTPQQLNMNLTATLTDGDNDTSKQQFSIALA